MDNLSRILIILILSASSAFAQERVSDELTKELARVQEEATKQKTLSPKVIISASAKDCALFEEIKAYGEVSYNNVNCQVQ